MCPNYANGISRIGFLFECPVDGKKIVKNQAEAITASKGGQIWEKKSCDVEDTSIDDCAYQADDAEPKELPKLLLLVEFFK